MRKNFYRCQKCGKKLIQRSENGIWHFVFGKERDGDGVSTIRTVDIYIYGSVKMKCLRSMCGHWNVLNFFPFGESSFPKEDAKQYNQHSLNP